MARGLIACAKAGSSGDTYNLATGTETSILRLAETINELTGTPFKVKPQESDRSKDLHDQQKMF